MIKDVSFLSAISIDDSNKEFFKRLEYLLSRLASTLPGTKPDDFKLIKVSRNYV